MTTPTPSLYGLINTITTQPGKRDAVLELLLEARSSLGSAGCERYIVGTSPTEPGKDLGVRGVDVCGRPSSLAAAAGRQKGDRRRASHADHRRDESHRNRHRRVLTGRFNLSNTGLGSQKAIPTPRLRGSSTKITQYQSCSRPKLVEPKLLEWPRSASPPAIGWDTNNARHNNAKLCGALSETLNDRCFDRRFVELLVLAVVTRRDVAGWRMARRHRFAPGLPVPVLMTQPLLS